MKKSISFVLTAFLFASTANAASLSCWNAFSKDKNPYLTATVVDDNTLVNVRVQTEQDAGPNSISSIARATPSLISTNRSPYKGYNQYTLNDLELILPQDLSSESLTEVGQDQFSKYDSKGDGINAIIVGYGDDSDGAGNHYSIRMRCRSNF